MTLRAGEQSGQLLSLLPSRERVYLFTGSSLVSGTVDTSSGLASWLVGSGYSLCAFTPVSPF